MPHPGLEPGPSDPESSALTTGPLTPQLWYYVEIQDKTFRTFLLVELLLALLCFSTKDFFSFFHVSWWEIVSSFLKHTAPQCKCTQSSVEMGSPNEAVCHRKVAKEFMSKWDHDTLNVYYLFIQKYIILYRMHAFDHFNLNFWRKYGTVMVQFSFCWQK